MNLSVGCYTAGVQLVNLSVECYSAGVHWVNLSAVSGLLGVILLAFSG